MPHQGASGLLVPVTGLEPVRCKTARDFKSLVSTIPPHRRVYDNLTLMIESVKNLDVDRNIEGSGGAGEKGPPRGMIYYICCVFIGISTW